MAEASIPVDLTNPGQVFACLGFVEAADILLGDARGGFDWESPSDMHVRFRLSAHGNDNPVKRVLCFLDKATVTSIAPKDSSHDTEKWRVTTNEYDSSEFPFKDTGSDVLPAKLCNPDGKCVTIDHWGDRGRIDRRDRVKFWAGAGGYPGAGLARDALKLIRDRAIHSANDPFSLSAEQSSSFRFDWRRDYVPIDAGFSPNVHGSVTMRGYPIVELLAAVGLTNARPMRHDALEYSYGVAGLIAKSLYDPVFLRVALGLEKPPFPGMPFRLFSMRLGWPGKKDQARCITVVTEETLSS